MHFILNHKLLSFVLVILFSIFVWHRYELYQFSRAYAVYADAAQKHDEAAFIPALPDNPLRRDLNRALSDALSEEKTPTERIARAREGLTLLVLAEGSIDAIGDVGKDAAEALSALDARAHHPGVLHVRGEMLALIETARHRAEVVADIRGLSYRANHHTKEIFDQIIADGGALTQEHIAALNRLIPSVEEQFDQRSNLYEELETIGDDITQKFVEVRKSL